VKRSSKVVRGKRTAERKKARSATKRRAVPERMRSDRRVEEITDRAGNHGANWSRGNPGVPPEEAVPLSTNAGSKMDEGRSDHPQYSNKAVPPTAIYPQMITATALAGLQAWFLLPLRALQSWQEAWSRLLPR